MADIGKSNSLGASTMASAETLGHFRLPLTMNKGHVDSKLAQHFFNTKNRYLDLLEEGRPEGHAIRNILGMLAYRLGQYKEALQYFDKILSSTEDPDNLNAIANRTYICEKLFRYKEARDCEQKIATLLTEVNTEEGENRQRQLRARSIAEQAFAFANEIYEESMTCERYRKAFDMYKKAIKLAGEDVAKGEREYWDYESGHSCWKIYKKIKFDKSKREFLRIAVNTFIKIAKSSKDKKLRSDSWTLLGQLFRQSGDFLPPIPEQFQTFLQQPEKCFDKALSLAPNKHRKAGILSIFATQYKRSNKSEALSLFDKSIQLDSTEFNANPRHGRASTLLHQYKQELKEFQTSRSAYRPDETLLRRAEEDLSVAVQGTPRPWYFEHMAEVLYYKATDPKGGVKQGNQGQENLRRALTYCAKALETPDGTKRPQVHKLRGMCLCAMAEHEVALACYKRAVDCELAASFHVGSIGQLVTEYAHILGPIASTLSVRPPLLADLVYWLDRAAQACHSTNWTLCQLKHLKQLPGLWKTFVKYCNDNGHQTKLKSIELAYRGHPPATQQLSAYRRQQSIPPTTKAGDEKLPGTDGGQLTRHPHAIRQHPLPASDEDSNLPHGQQRSVPATTAEYSKKRLHGENVTASPSAAQLGGESTESDTVRITYLVNMKTRKIQQIEIIPLVEDIQNKDVTSKHIRPAPKESFNREFEYDFFVIYSNSASIWVQYSLLEELEGSQGTSRLKGCIKDRDFRPGKPILTEYSESIDNSSCILIVITNDLELDTFFGFAMLQAIQHGRLVIPVQLEDRDMPVLLGHLMPIDATGPVDWAKLVRSIEQQI